VTGSFWSLAGKEAYMGTSSSKDRQYWMSEVKKIELGHYIASNAVLSGGLGRSQAPALALQWELGSFRQTSI
jgi:hypothetical protein